MPFQRVKQFKDLELAYDCPAPAGQIASISGFSVKFWTDMPGGAMAVRATLTYPYSSGGRRTYTLPLDGIEGTLYKVQVIPNTADAGSGRKADQVKLFGGVLRARAVGVYIDGSAGEIWDSTEQGVGI